MHREIYPKADLRSCSEPEVATKGMPASRQSGDPYITHPLAVAKISAEQSFTTFRSVPRHDTVETPATPLEALTE